jgi:hypothetical protein
MDTAKFFSNSAYRLPSSQTALALYTKEESDAKFHHHPSSKHVVLSTLIHRARALCDEDSLQAELVFLRDVFKQND